MNTTAAAQLNSADLTMFARLGIPAELLAQAGIRRVTDSEARELFGIRGDGDMAGIIFPYLDQPDGHRITARLRRDNPEILEGRTQRKYVCPFGDRRILYFPPGAAELLADPTVPIVLVESEKAALALTAWAVRRGRRIVAIGMGGCWGWRATIGKTVNPNGERVPEKGPAPGLEQAANGRTSFVLLDVNVATNENVRAACNALVHQLRKQGADAVVLVLPPVPSVNGPDDFIALCGDQAMTLVFEHPRGEPAQFASGDWPDPSPLGDELPPVEAFDLEYLPPSFRSLVKGVSDRMQTPLDHDYILHKSKLICFTYHAKPPFLRDKPAPVVRRLRVRPRMTIALGFMTGNAVILATDSQEVISDYAKTTTQKIRITHFVEAGWRIGVAGSADDSTYLDAFYGDLQQHLGKIRGYDYAKIVKTIEDRLHYFHKKHIWQMPKEERTAFEMLIAVQGIKPHGSRALLHTHKTLVVPVQYRSIGIGQYLADYLCGRLDVSGTGIDGVVYNSPTDEMERFAVYVLQQVKSAIHGCDGETNVAVFGGDATFRWLVNLEVKEIESWFDRFHADTTPLFRSISHPEASDQQFDRDLVQFNADMRRTRMQQARDAETEAKRYAEFVKAQEAANKNRQKK